MSKLEKFLIIIIILNLFATLFIVFGKKHEKKEEVKVFEISNFNEFVKEYRSGQDPDLYRDFIQDLVENKFNELYLETKDLTKSELKRYYEEQNAEDEFSEISGIAAKYGISDYDTLEKIIDKLRLIDNNKAKYKKCKIIKNSCEYNANYTKTQIEIQYTKSQKIILNVEMANYIEYDVQTFKISVKEDD